MEEQEKKTLGERIEEKYGCSCSCCDDLIRNQGISDPDIARAAYEAGILYPRILYQDAPADVRDKLIDLLDKGEPDKSLVNNYLVALAMIGDETVAEYFQKWEEAPRPWRESLYVGPYHYAEEGGWCIENGKKRQLFFDACYALEKSETAAPEENVYGGTAEEKCPFCESSYVNVLVLDGRDERLSFLGFHGKIKIKYCEGCLPWSGTVFCKYVEDGESTILRHDDGEEYFCDDEDLNDRTPFVLSKKMVPKSYCDEFERCAVGGRPAFVDDASFAVCPECGKKMMHLAQLGEEWTTCGTHYIQICRDCQIAAIQYQQT